MLELVVKSNIKVAVSALEKWMFRDITCGKLSKDHYTSFIGDSQSCTCTLKFISVHVQLLKTFILTQNIKEQILLAGEKFLK